MIIQGDAREFKIGEKAHLVWADPPSGLGLNEGNSDDTPDPLDEQFFIKAWLNNIISQLEYDSYLCICTTFKMRYLYERMLQTQFSCNLWQEIVWHYNFGRYTRKKFVQEHDSILIFKFGKPHFYWQNVAIPSQRLIAGDKRADARGKTPGTVWNIPRVPGNSKDRQFVKGPHRSSQPEELCERIVLALTRPTERVFDPFCGSGTMAVICKAYNREYLGIDICKEYVEEANERLNKEGVKTA